MAKPKFAVGDVVTRPMSSYPSVTFRVTKVSKDLLGKSVYIVSVDSYTLEYEDGAEVERTSDGRGFLVWESDLEAKP